MNYINEKIVSYINSIYGNDLTKLYQEQIEQQSAQFIRVNTSKISAQVLTSSLLSKYEIQCVTIPGYLNILRTADRRNLLGKTLEHTLGLYYIQSLSSFIPPLALNPGELDLVLDLCSAPGSKTTELGEIMINRGTIVANEIQVDRLKSLVFNMDRMNQMNAGVVHFKGEQLNTIYHNYFDKILVDAPCSGLGIIQKKNEVNDWWTLERVNRLSELQLKLLVSAIKMLQVGGEIVYSTCTLTVEENELVIDKILKKYPVEVVNFDLHIPSRGGITQYNNQQLSSSLVNAKRILPWDVNSDGFFIIKLIKTGKTQQPHKRDLRLRDIRLLNSSDKTLKNQLTKLADYFNINEKVFAGYKYIIKNNNVFFINKNWNDPNPGIFERIGTKFGLINKHNHITLHTHAAQVLSNHISQNIFELKNLSELKNYLEGGTVKTSFSLKGQYLVKYGGYTLGTAVMTETGLKSQFPRSRRTQEIYTELI